MLGALIVAIAILVVIPVSFMVGGVAVAGLLGWSLEDNGEATHPGSELIALNR